MGHNAASSPDMRRATTASCCFGRSPRSPRSIAPSPSSWARRRSGPFGLAILEAMAAGLPLVLTRTDGPREFVTDERVSWVEPDDEAGLAGALRAALERGAQKIPYDLGRFAPQRALMEIEAFYRRVLSRRARQWLRNSDAR